MLRRVGMSLLLSWICLNAFAQLPHPNDTLENGKKVPFNQFLGRFSVFNEFYGTTYPFSLNASYSFAKTELLIADITLGTNLRTRTNSVDFTYRKRYNDWNFPLSINLYVGRRKSRLNVRAGYTLALNPSWFTDIERPYPSCGHYCPTPPRHNVFVSVGYTYQHQRGFFVGLNALAILRFPLKENGWSLVSEHLFPMGGLTVGYRLPSKQQHKEWRERGFKRRVLRIEKPLKAEESIDDVFYDDSPLEIDSTDILEIEQKLAKLKKRHERYLKQEQRLNGRSLVYAEFFGAAGIWSLNYTYTHPIAKSKTWMMEYRGGVGTDKSHLQAPIHLGVKAMKNYRGTGVYFGVIPQYNWENGSLGATYFLEHNVEFHFAYGLTGGVAFYLFFDPVFYKHYWDVAPYGGFFLGYRLPQLKKS